MKPIYLQPFTTEMPFSTGELMQAEPISREVAENPGGSGDDSMGGPQRIVIP